MSHSIEIGADFAAVMQELSAQAAGAQTSEEGAQPVSKRGPGVPEMLRGMQMLAEQIERLEDSLVKKLEALESAPNSPPGDFFSAQFQKLDEQLTAIRNNETVNQKLFDSLHKELISYRDNFVRDSLQKPFIRDLLVLFDDLSSVAAQLEKAVAGKGSSRVTAQSRDNVNNVLHFLLEILHRLEVNEIDPRETVDLNLHRVISYEPAAFIEEDGRIVMRVKRGFVWRDRVLRPEEVIAKRFQ